MNPWGSADADLRELPPVRRPGTVTAAAIVACVLAVLIAGGGVAALLRASVTPSWRGTLLLVVVVTALVVGSAGAWLGITRWALIATESGWLLIAEIGMTAIHLSRGSMVPVYLVGRLFGALLHAVPIALLLTASSTRFFAGRRIQGEHSQSYRRMKIGMIAGVAILLAALQILFLLNPQVSGRAGNGDIAELTPRMMIGENQVPPVAGGVWQTWVKVDPSRRMDSGKPIANPVECVPPARRDHEAGRVGIARWINKDDHSEIGVQVLHPTSVTSADLGQWVYSCADFRMDDGSVQRVHHLPLVGLPAWAVTATLTAVRSSFAIEMVLGVHRGVLVQVLYATNASKANASLTNALPAIFNAQIASLDAQ